MACPTCDHTMQNLGVENQKIFWCPRCGTLKTISGDYEEIEQTIFIKRIFNVAKKKLAYPSYQDIQKCDVSAYFTVNPKNLDHPSIDLYTVK